MVHASGEDVLAAAGRMEQVAPGTGRGKVHHLVRGILLVDDSYNSSPPALASVLETMRLSNPRGRRVLVMGDMLELGPMKTALHREAGRRAGAAGVQMLVAVGMLSRETAEAARRAGVGEVHHHVDSASCAKALGDLLGDGDLIVVKGSRGMRMGRVVRALTVQFGEAN
jgi:UDP-N-acetylmuramoyl-tripeptide--D-alanyl-D-alanine ligase